MKTNGRVQTTFLVRSWYVVWWFLLVWKCRRYFIRIITTIVLSSFEKKRFFLPLNELILCRYIPLAFIAVVFSTPSFLFTLTRASSTFSLSVLDYLDLFTFILPLGPTAIIEYFLNDLIRVRLQRTYQWLKDNNWFLLDKFRDLRLISENKLIN